MSSPSTTAGQSACFTTQLNTVTIILPLFILVVVQLNGTQVTRCHTKLNKYHAISILADVQELSICLHLENL